MRRSKTVSPKLEANTAVRRQAIKVSEVHARLYVWAERLRKLIANHTGVAVPEVALAVELDRRKRMGWYQVGRDGLQLRGHINVNSLYIDLPECWLLEIVAHEILHFAEELAGESSEATRSSFHTAWFRWHAAALGFPCDEHGCGTITAIHPKSPFGAFLIRHRLKLVPFKIGGKGSSSRGGTSSAIKLPPPRSTMVKWSCGCTNIRAATKVEARCLRCGRRFQLASAARSEDSSLQSEAGNELFRKLTDVSRRSRWRGVCVSASV